MTPIKAILEQIQKNETAKEDSEYNDDKYQQMINAFAISNANLNLCKHFLEGILDINFSYVGSSSKLKNDVLDFLEILNKK